jgi:hypothetical protein
MCDYADIFTTLTKYKENPRFTMWSLNCGHNVDHDTKKPIFKIKEVQQGSLGDVKRYILMPDQPLTLYNDWNVLKVDYKENETTWRRCFTSVEVCLEFGDRDIINLTFYDLEQQKHVNYYFASWACHKQGWRGLHN